MRLLRFDDGGRAILGALRGDAVVSLAPLMERYPTMLALVAGGDAALERARVLVKTAQPHAALADVRLLAPIKRPGKVLAIGMNYRKHIEEAKRLGQPVPQNQFWFNKQTSCLAGPHDDTDPGVSEQLDCEVELCAVIGRTAKRVSREDAPNHVFGYMVANDVSARDW